MSGSLELIYDSIVSKKRDDVTFWIPELWIANNKKVKILEKKNNQVRVEPYQYLKSQIELIMKDHSSSVEYHRSLSQIQGLALSDGKIKDNNNQRIPGDWLPGANIYGLYVRNFSSYDHNQDGVLGGSKDNVTVNKQGIKETGTFLKSLTILPYIKDLGFNTVYLLPVSLIGIANKKGELGCPYGLRNPFKIDPVFHDPLVDEFDVNVEFRAFVEAAHILGLRVMLDFVPRTAARDSELIKEHPDWFYWIDKSADATFHSPEFTPNELHEIHERCGRIHDNRERHHMIPPHEDYVRIYSEPPKPENVKHVSDEKGYMGKTNGREVVVPGAFADWPPDDIQPPWTDVTYFKLYEDEDFNYVAYNTIRMYDSRITKINKPLWETISNFIPFFQEEFGIDGARIDMGHALPFDLEKMMIEKARAIDPDFGFLSEDFNVWAQARAKGYNMIMGNSWFTLSRTMVPESNGDSMGKNFVKRLPNYPNPVLGSPETADTPRAAARKGGIKFSKAVWTLINTLPNTVPFIVAGFELGETVPTNLGLDFTHEEIEALSKKPLGFFDRAKLDWDSVFSPEMIQHLKEINRFREENKGNILHLDNFIWLESDVEGAPSMSPRNPVVAFLRRFEQEMVTILTAGIFGEVLYPIEVENTYLIIANMDCESEIIVTLQLAADDLTFTNIFSDEKYKTVQSDLNLKLKPGEVIVAVQV